MNITKQHKTTRKRSGLVLAILILVLAGAGLGLWQAYQAGWLPALQTAEETSPAYQSTAARYGDLALAISGSGTVITEQTVDLGFSVPGEIARLMVGVGDTVSKGQVLAKLSNITALELKVNNQALAVQKSQAALDDLLNNGEAALAQALADKISAQTAFEEAQANLRRPGDGRCQASKTQEYYFQWLYAQQRVTEWEDHLNDPNTGYGRDFILEKLTPLRKERDKAYSNLTYCQGYTDAEIRASEADLQLARAKLEQATAEYDELKANSGVHPAAVAAAQAELEAARLQLSQAQDDLAGATIVSPVDGTVMAVNGSVRQAAGQGVVITIADLTHPRIQVNIDETDLSNFAAGCSAQITFDSLPGETFPGVVTDVSPSLVSVQSVSMVRGWVELEQVQTASGKNLPLGLAASVEITCQQADQVLLIPAQALYEESGQAAFVYVLNAQGQPEKREVAVGIRTVALAEIRSGLSEGERVITSQVAGQ